MKKYLFLLLTAFAVMSCSDDSDVNVINKGDEFPLGAWYNEEMNEEDVYNKSGTFYGKFCTVNIAGEQEGTYELSENGNKLTWRYKYMGQNQVTDWTVFDRNDYSFMIRSNYSSLLYGKIVETYPMKVGQTQQIQFPSKNGVKVNAYGSRNNRIAEVSSSGLVSAVGEKGTTYIKLSTDKGVVWVKVVVGLECADLWYDFISLIGNNYNELKSVLGNPFSSSDDGLFFAYTFSQHNHIDNLYIYLNENTKRVSHVVLDLKSAISETEILSYLDSRYYQYIEDSDNIYYTNLEKREDSHIGIIYDKSNKRVYFGSI